MKYLTLPFLLFAVACSTDPYLPDNGNVGGPGPGPTPNPTDSCDPNVVYFQQQVLPLLISNCAVPGCHSGAGQDGVILTDYNTVVTTGDVTPFNISESDLYEVLVDPDPDKRMPPPPAAQLGSAEIQTIANWIAQGAMNSSCVSSDCDTSAVTFTGTIQPLIDQNCKGCHSGTSPQGGIALTNYSQVQTLAANGSLLGVVRAEAGYVAMPYNSNSLNSCKIRQLELWVAQGAPNN